MASKKLMQALAVTAELCGGTQLSELAAKAFLNALEAYPEDAVIRALGRCTTEVSGRLTPAQVIQRIDDGRPGAEEAWPIASKGGTDERITKVWTDEMEEAWTGCAEIFDSDPIAARMTFKEIYSRAVRENREKHLPTHWHPTLGFDKQGRIEAIEAAISKGLLTVQTLPEGIKHLAAPETPARIALNYVAEHVQLEAPTHEKANASVIDENMRKIRELLGGKA